MRGQSSKELMTRRRLQRQAAARKIQGAFRKFRKNRKVYGDPAYKDMDFISTDTMYKRRLRF
jgi:hypothetical protein